MSYLNKYYSLPSVKNKIYNNTITLNMDYDYYNIYIKGRKITHKILLKDFINQSEEIHKKMMTDFVNDFIRDIFNNLDEYDKTLLHFFKENNNLDLKEYISLNIEKMNYKNHYQVQYEDYVFIVISFKGFEYNFTSEELDRWGGVEKYIEKQKIKKKIEDF